MQTLRELKSVDDFTIRRKAWPYLNAKGDRVENPLINVRAKGVLDLGR
jgi:hypothetical protein